MKSAVLSPHLDDAVLSCWHVLESRDPVTIVNVCTASPPAGTPLPDWDRLTGAEDPVVRMGERRDEDRRALDVVGRTSVDLGLLDWQYGPRETPASWLTDRLRGLLDPDTVIHAPASLGRHPDHDFVRDAALELAREGRPVTIYADLPHCIPRGWPGWVSGVAEPRGSDVGAEWAEVLAAAGLAVPRLVPRVRPLDAGTRERKLRALAEYGTQRAALDDMAFVALEDPRALAFEVSWGVPASALGGEHEGRSEAVVAEAGGKLLHNGG